MQKYKMEDLSVVSQRVQIMVKLQHIALKHSNHVKPLNSQYEMYMYDLDNKHSATY